MGCGLFRRETLKETFDLISELNLNEFDISKIYEESKDLLRNPEVKKILKKICAVIKIVENTIQLDLRRNKIKNYNDLKYILRELWQNIETINYGKILNLIKKQEKLILIFIEIYSTGWMSSEGWIVRKLPLKVSEKFIPKNEILDWSLENGIFVALIILLGVAHSSFLDFESDPFEAAPYNTEKYRINYNFFFKSES